jgi:hypothetical protein
VCERERGEGGERDSPPPEVDVEIVSHELGHAAEIHPQHRDGVSKRLQLQGGGGLVNPREGDTTPLLTSRSTISNCRYGPHSRKLCWMT